MTSSKSLTRMKYEKERLCVKYQNGGCGNCYDCRIIKALVELESEKDADKEKALIAQRREFEENLIKVLDSTEFIRQFTKANDGNYKELLDYLKPILTKQALTSNNDSHQGVSYGC